MAKHKPAESWLTRFPPAYPYFEIATENERELKIMYFKYRWQHGCGITISRKDARLLAKRINQCLDETK